jgi:hypothetical protein
MPRSGVLKEIRRSTYEMVISLFLLFASFCWLSVTLPSDSDVPAEAAGIDDMDAVSRCW